MNHDTDNNKDLRRHSRVSLLDRLLIVCSVITRMYTRMRISIYVMLTRKLTPRVQICDESDDFPELNDLDEDEVK